MNVSYRKGFLKDLERTHADVRRAFVLALQEIKASRHLSELSNIKKLQGRYKYVYRLRLLNHRAVFVFIESEEGIEFLYIAPRNEAYSKKFQALLRGL